MAANKDHLVINAGGEALLQEQQLKAAFGVSPLPCLRELLAVVAASASSMSSTLSMLAKGQTTCACSIATDSAGCHPCHPVSRFSLLNASLLGSVCEPEYA